MMIIYGSFYLISNASQVYHGGFTLTDRDKIMNYILLVILEFGVYFIIMGKTAMKYKFYYVVLIELLLIPCYAMFTGDFIMRASIPALFILMTFTIKFFLDGNYGIKRYMLIAALLIGAWTPINEFNRTIAFTSIKILDDCGLLPAKTRKGLWQGESLECPCRKACRPRQNSFWPIFAKSCVFLKACSLEAVLVPLSFPPCP